MFTDFKDSSTNDFAITASGEAQLVKTVKKYGNAAGYFDGDGDYLEIVNNDAFELEGNDFTIECWIRPTILDSNYHSIASKASASQDQTGWILYINVDNTINFLAGTGGWDVLLFSEFNLTINTWYHVAATRSGNNWYLFINGDLKASTTNSLTLNTGNLPLYIGWYPYFDGLSTSDQSFGGYIDDLRITKGIARYTANFTPPTQQLPDPSDPHGANVSLLLHMDGTNGSQSFVDSSSNNFTITANGDAQISDAEKKFGNGAGYFDGDADFLELPDSPEFDFGSDDFTIECWFYSNSPSGFQTLIARWNDGDAFFLGIDLDVPNVQLYVNGTLAIFGAAPVINQWYHIAAVRSGTGIKLFLNGVQVGSTYNIGYTAIVSSNALLRIGADAGGNPKFEGYIDEVRITKGVARYTANFTPQTAPFANPTV